MPPQARADMLRLEAEAEWRNLLYVALSRARDRLVWEWPAFLKDRDEDVPGATCLFHIFEDGCAPKPADGKLQINKVDCPATIATLLEQAGFTEYGNGNTAIQPRFGAAAPMPAVPLTSWRLHPSQKRPVGPAPASWTISLGAPWPGTMNTAQRGTSLHLALHAYLARPELAMALPAATGLDEVNLGLVAEHAEALQIMACSTGLHRSAL